MSPRFLISGYLYARNFLGNSAISDSHNGLTPNGSSTNDAASMPEQMLPNVLIFVIQVFYQF